MLMKFSSWVHYMYMFAEVAVLLNVYYEARNESPERVARRLVASSCNASQLPPFLVICFHVYVMLKMST